MARQEKIRLEQRDRGGRLNDFRTVFQKVEYNNSFGKTLLTEFSPFSKIDPYHHFITFELQLNNNHAIGNITVKTNQADIVITDVKNKTVYVVEAKLHVDFDYNQMENLKAAVMDITVNNRNSVFYY